MDVAKLIREFRAVNGLSKAQLAKELKVSIRALNYYESGQRTPPLKRWLKVTERFSNGYKPTDS